MYYFGLVYLELSLIRHFRIEFCCFENFHEIFIVLLGLPWVPTLIFTEFSFSSFPRKCFQANL